MNCQITAVSLRTAANAVEKLQADGVHVIAHYSNGRVPVLIVDKKPDAITGVVRMRVPKSSTVDAHHVFASHYEGVQIEWTQAVQAAARLVSHG